MKVLDAYSLTLDSLKALQASGCAVRMQKRNALMIPERPDGIDRDRWFIASISCRRGTPAKVEATERELREMGIRFDTGGTVERGYCRDWYLDHSFKVA